MFYTGHNTRFKRDRRLRSKRSLLGGFIRIPTLPSTRFLVKPSYFILGPNNRTIVCVTVCVSVCDYVCVCPATI